MAWHYKEYSDDETLAELEDKARVSKLGLWAEPNALPPWEFRKGRKIDDVPPQAVSSPRKEPTPRQAITSPQSQAGSHWLNTSSNTSALSQLNFGIDGFEFTAGIVDSHLPVDAALSGVDIV